MLCCWACWEGLPRRHTGARGDRKPDCQRCQRCGADAHCHSVTHSAGTCLGLHAEPVGSVVACVCGCVVQIMSNSGTALLGIGRGSGPDRAEEAIYDAINTPLLQGHTIQVGTGTSVILTQQQQLAQCAALCKGCRMSSAAGPGDPWPPALQWENPITGLASPPATTPHLPLELLLVLLVHPIPPPCRLAPLCAVCDRHHLQHHQQAGGTW